MIKFSIITVCLNAGEDLLSTVESCLSQTYKNFEIIVKDGGSHDSSIENLPQSEHLHIYSQADSGIYDAMNQAIDLSSGELLLFINAGDLLYDDNTLNSIAEFVEHQNADFYYGRCYNEALKLYSNSPKRLTPFFCYRSMICHQAMVFKRDYLVKKKYDCSFTVSADRELLCYTALSPELKTQYIPLIIARYKGNGFCESEKSKMKIKDENKRIIKKYFSRWRRFIFRIRYALTLPTLRSKIARSPKLRRAYKSLVGIIYGNRAKTNEEQQ